MMNHRDFVYLYEVIMTTVPTKLDMIGCDGLYLKAIKLIKRKSISNTTNGRIDLSYSFKLLRGEYGGQEM